MYLFIVHLFVNHARIEVNGTCICRCFFIRNLFANLSLHPHCMCRYKEVSVWEVDISRQKDNVKQAGDKWLNGLSDENRRLVLGIEGNEAWKQGENWQKYMRNWRGLAEPETRLKKAVKDVKIVRSRGKTFVFNLQLFADPNIGIAERLRIGKELNRWLRTEEFDGTVRQKAIGNHVYMFRAIEFNEYEFLGKELIVEDIHERRRKNGRRRR